MPDQIAILSGPPLIALVEHLGVLRHDLGKYIAFQSRSLTKDSDTKEVIAALSSDLLSTRRGPRETIDAMGLWRSLSPELRGERPLGDGLWLDLRGDETFDALERAMHEVAAVIASLNQSTLADRDLQRVVMLVREVASLCNALWRRARERLGSDPMMDGRYG